MYISWLVFFVSPAINRETSSRTSLSGGIAVGCPHRDSYAHLEEEEEVRRLPNKSPRSSLSKTHTQLQLHAVKTERYMLPDL